MKWLTLPSGTSSIGNGSDPIDGGESASNGSTADGAWMATNGEGAGTSSEVVVASGEGRTTTSWADGRETGGKKVSSSMRRSRREMGREAEWTYVLEEVGRAVDLDGVHSGLDVTAESSERAEGGQGRNGGW